MTVAAIVADPDVQARAQMSQEAIEDYAATVDVLPPIDVHSDGATHWVSDGFHRLAAHKLAGREKILAYVREGDKRSAMLHAAHAPRDRDASA